jgi:hypothetical protein
MKEIVDTNSLLNNIRFGNSDSAHDSKMKLVWYINNLLAENRALLEEFDKQADAWHEEGYEGAATRMLTIRGKLAPLTAAEVERVRGLDAALADQTFYREQYHELTQANRALQADNERLREQVRCRLEAMERNERQNPSAVTRGKIDQLRWFLAALSETEPKPLCQRGVDEAEGWQQP